MRTDWRPTMSVASYKRRPPIGALIGHNRKAYRVASIETLEPGDWSEKAAALWTGQNPWHYVPFRVILTTPDGSGRRVGMTVEPWNYIAWYVIPDEYAVCVKCGEMSPCPEYEQRIVAEKETKAALRAMTLLDGCCPACEEPITSRQKTHHFPGPNILNPLGRDGVTFHARQKCSWAAANYESKWVAADPTRKRSLLTLSCEGTVIVHADGSAECYGAAGSDCPDIRARHRAHTACYIQSHGCGRGCSQSGHPGTRLSRRVLSNGTLP